MDRSHCVKPALKEKKSNVCSCLHTIFPAQIIKRPFTSDEVKEVDASLFILTKKKVEDRPLLSTAKANYFPPNESPFVTILVYAK